MEKVILFNEQEEFLEFPSIKDAAKHLDVKESYIILCAKVNKNKIKGYYIEIEKDKIVQYHFKTPIKVWDNLITMCDTLMIHPEAVKKSLKSEGCISSLHFKYFSNTKGRPL